MVSKLRVTILAGAVALALGGPAMANTNLDAAATGDVFINVVDTTSNVSFLYDTGVSQALFNSTGTYNYNFTSDANYQTFAAQATGHTLDYSVLSATKAGSIFAQTGQMLFTSNGSVTAQIGANLGQAITGGVNAFFTGANANFSGSNSNTVTQVVKAIGSQASVQSSENPSVAAYIARSRSLLKSNRAR